MLGHLKHMASVRPGKDGETAIWALAQIEGRDTSKMAGEKDGYQLEPQAAFNETRLSAAISLKRIADALQPDAELQEWKDAERKVSEAYVRLRSMIPGALKTPHAPTTEQVWETTERSLAELLKSPPPLTDDDFIAASRHLANVTNAPADHAAETVRVVFQAVRWAREGREPQSESTATMDHAGMPEDEPKFYDDIQRGPSREVAPRDPVDESFVDYTGLDGPALLEALGADAMKWGEAFCQTAHKLGIIIDQPDWMGGWFANAMAMAEQRAVAPIQHERDQLYRHVEALLSHTTSYQEHRAAENRAARYFATIMPPMSLPSSDGVRCRCVLRLEKCTPDVCRYGNARGDSL